MCKVIYSEFFPNTLSVWLVKAQMQNPEVQRADSVLSLTHSSSCAS